MDTTKETTASDPKGESIDEPCPPACLFNGAVAGASSYVLGLAFGFGAYETNEDPRTRRTNAHTPGESKPMPKRCEPRWTSKLVRS